MAASPWPTTSAWRYSRTVARTRLPRNGRRSLPAIRHAGFSCTRSRPVRRRRGRTNCAPARGRRATHCTSMVAPVTPPAAAGCRRRISVPPAHPGDRRLMLAHALISLGIQSHCRSASPTTEAEYRAAVISADGPLPPWPAVQAALAALAAPTVDDVRTEASRRMQGAVRRPRCGASVGRDFECAARGGAADDYDPARHSWRRRGARVDGGRGDAGGGTVCGRPGHRGDPCGVERARGDVPSPGGLRG